MGLIMIGQTISHYKILEKLGAGGMGVVYKAQDRKLERLVALKFLPSPLEANDAEKQRFIIEARAASALDHPNLGTIYEIDETADGQMFIAMAYYDGETLKKKIANGKLPVANAIDISRQMAQGLAKAHQHGIVHRDIKPANAIITKDGTVKIVDFGLAKFIGESRLTKSGATLGTIAYMSPEQTRGEEVDARADLWSLGVVIYEMLAGQLPFRGVYDAAIVYSIVNENHPALSRLRSEVPAELESLVNKCLEKDPAHRYQHADDLIVDLRRLQRDSEPKDLPAEKGKDTRKLAAIMFTDMVGYSALTQKNEELALELLDEHRRLLRPLFPKYGGREIETIGDAFFVEFASALQAARCAIEIQKTLHERNAAAAAERHIKLRIGLHLGDVVHTGKNVHGDGVNIAARVEPLAEPGGICLSEDVARQIQNKIDVPLERLGKGELKNIQLPVQIYRVVLPWQKQAASVAERFYLLWKKRKAQWYRLAAAFVVAASVLVAGYFLLMPLLPQRRSELNPNATFRTLPIPFTQIWCPGLSQDGNWVAFPAADAKGKCEVYLMNTSGGEPRRITSSDSSLAEIMYADISPDGSQIVYQPYSFKTQKYEIYIISSLGGLSKRIVKIGFLPRWRPDGQRIGYILNTNPFPSNSGKKEFWSVKPDGSDNRLEFVDSVGTKGYGGSFSWSPDGQSFAWLRRFPEGYYEVIVRELATGKERQLTFDQKSIDEVCWTRRDEIIFSSDKAGNSNLWMAPVAGGQAVQITKGTGGEAGIQISADGKKLLYHQADVSGYLWIANSNGSDTRQITFDERAIFIPSFSPDGRRLLFFMADPNGSTSHIYLMDRDGSNRQQLTFGSETPGPPQWSPDGQWIAYSSWPSSATWDSAKVYLIAASNPTAPRLLGKGFRPWWVNPKTLIADRQFKDWLFSIDGAPPQKIYEDSTRVYPILEEKYILFRDFRKGRAGWWIVPVTGLNGPSTGSPKKILSGNYNIAVAPNRKFFLYYATNVGEVRKMSLPDGKDELFPVQLSEWQFNNLGVGVSYDGKEIVYVEPHNRAKLVMIENPFK